jgi:hypothetical protein
MIVRTLRAHGGKAVQNRCLRLFKIRQLENCFWVALTFACSHLCSLPDTVGQHFGRLMGIPAKTKTIPGRTRTAFRGKTNTHRSEATLALRLSPNRSSSSRIAPSGALAKGPRRERRKGCGERGGSPCPRSTQSDLPASASSTVAPPSSSASSHRASRSDEHCAPSDRGSHQPPSDRRSVRATATPATAT